ncbi:MAG: efflux RND transporter periplasmic adaptor subunit [Gemmatimonadales bacterium]|nr:MAG: efflux RND transporter periplasmic adaptor subunit [Gemmatimonadales bacterium]
MRPPLRKTRIVQGSRPAVVAMVAMVALSGCRDEEARMAEATVQEERVTSVAVVEVVPRDLSREIELSGSIEPIREIRVAARMGGIVRAAPHEEGDRVTGGQILARFDVSEEEAELRRARAILEEAERSYDRARELVAQELVSASEYESARASRAVAESEVQLWETRADFGVVRAPASGVVTARFVEVGEGVASGDVLFHLADLSLLVIRVGVSDVDAPQLSEGAPVDVRIDASPGRSWEAEIRRVFPSADPDSRLVPVEVALTDPEHRVLRPGSLARLRISVDPRAGVLAVPNEALLASTPDDPFLYVIDGEGRLQRRAVVPGVSRRDWTEILEGLDEGERVVGSNPAVLAEGQRVQVAGTLTHPSDGN